MPRNEKRYRLRLRMVWQTHFFPFQNSKDGDYHETKGGVKVLKSNLRRLKIKGRARVRGCTGLIVEFEI